MELFKFLFYKFYCSIRALSWMENNVWVNYDYIENWLLLDQET